MTDTLVPGALSRCCESHPDWATLRRHLLESFPTLTIQQVVAEVRRAQQAAEIAAHDPDRCLRLAEAIARAELQRLAGIVDIRIN
jgi:pterin-4a-carbinolamine dehydratase